MRKYILYRDRVEDEARVIAIYSDLWEGMNEQMPEGFFYEDDIPEATYKEGFNTVLYVRLGEPDNPELFYKFEEIPPQPPTELQIMRRELDDLTEVVTELILGGE